MPKSSQDKTISNLPNESLTISSIVEKIQETANKSGAEFINKIVQPEKNDLELNDTSSDLIPEERLRILSSFKRMNKKILYDFDLNKIIFIKIFR